MSRKKHAILRPIQPDVRFQSELVSRFVNRLMRRGKKAVAFNIFYGAMDIVKQKTSIADDAEALEVFEKALENIKPAVEVKSRRVGGTNYQVPIEVRPARRNALAMRWLVSFANQRNEYTAAERLGNEIVDAYNNNGAAVRKREDTHRMADANKAFAHYRY